MVHAGLDVLAMHRDVILQVRVGQKDISPSVLHFLQKTRKVGRAQVKFFTEDNAEVSRVLLNPFVNAFAIVDAVVRVLKCQSQLQAFTEFLVVDETAEKLGCRVAQEVGGAKSPENILIAPAENSSSSRTGGDPRGLVSVRHHRFGLAESSRVATEDRHDIVRGYRTLNQTSGFCLIRTIVVENFFDRELLPQLFHRDATTLIDLVDGQLNPLSLILPRLCFPAADGEHDPDTDFVGASLFPFPTSRQYKR